MFGSREGLLNYHNPSVHLKAVSYVTKTKSKKKSELLIFFLWQPSPHYPPAQEP